MGTMRCCESSKTMSSTSNQGTNRSSMISRPQHQQHRCIVFAVLLLALALVANSLWLLRPNSSLSMFTTSDLFAIDSQQLQQHENNNNDGAMIMMTTNVQQRLDDLEARTSQLEARLAASTQQQEQILAIHSDNNNPRQHQQVTVLARNDTTNTTTTATTSRHMSKEVVSSRKDKPIQEDDDDDDDSVNLKTAICHKTLFGAVNLDIVRRWCEYNHALGFDHIYIWYEVSATNYTGFQELQDLPFVTLLLNDDVKAYVVPDKSTPDFQYVRMISKHTKETDSKYDQKTAKGTQREIEKHCLNMTDALGYDWVLNADADEYLWFNQTMGVKDFLSMYPKKTHYISLGKHMHTMAARVEPNETASEDESGFGLDHYAFTEGPFCRVDFWNPTQCFGDKGSCKVIVRPSYWKDRGVNVHGWGKPRKDQTKVHSSTTVAHLKEFPFLFHSLNVTVRPRHDFNATSREDLWLVRNSLPHRQSGFRMYYDAGLQPWFQYVASRKQQYNATLSSK